MPSPEREWDEDPWDHSTPEAKGTWKPKKVPYPAAYTPPKSYQLHTLSPALTKALEESLRKQVEQVVNDAFQRIMDRLDEIEEEIARGR